MEINKAALEKYFGSSYARIEQFAELLHAEGDMRGLIGPRELPRLWERHILNSAAVVWALNEEFEGDLSHLNDKSLLDVGSGAGFPGIITACMLPQTQVYLLDSMQRRTEWLEYVCDKLDLSNVEVIRGRAEDVISSGLVPPCDFVTARAVASLKKLLPWTVPFLDKSGILLALKGQGADQEIIDAKYVLRKYNVCDAKVLEVDLAPIIGVNTDELLTRVVRVQIS